MGAIQWLVLCAAGLVIAITLGTAYFALQFRERALEVAERELNNTALLLSRHFDQQLSDLQHVHDDVVTFIITCRLAVPLILVALAVVSLVGSSLTVVVANQSHQSASRLMSLARPAPGVNDPFAAPSLMRRR